MTEKEPNTVVLPGDHVPLPVTNKVRLGPGLKLQGSEAVAIKCGILRKRKPGSIWVDSSQKRPFSVVNENVIGIVVGRPGENYSIDIGTHRQGSLSSLAFEGATKRNRPFLNIGDLVPPTYLFLNFLIHCFYDFIIEMKVLEMVSENYLV